MVMATDAVSPRETLPLFHQFFTNPTSTLNYIPKYQRALVLNGIRQPYDLVEQHPVPTPTKTEHLVVKLYALGLNPIDWKSVDFGYGIPELPYVAGRDFAGVVVRAPRSRETSLSEGDLVLCASTDYRDLRKSAFQEYALASEHTVCKLGNNITIQQGACLGTAFVASALAAGVCLGINIAAAEHIQGVDLFSLVRSLSSQAIPEDIRSECIDSITAEERPRRGEWIVIWGGSSTSALFLSQMASSAGLKVILVVDVAKHGTRLANTGSLLVDCHDSKRAADIIRGITNGKLLYGIDTVGRETAADLAGCLDTTSQRRSHLVALAAPPKARLGGIVYHSVPIKLFHEVPVVGKALMSWLRMALESRVLKLPSISLVPGGLQGVNAGLDQMREGKVSGRRLVVPV